MTWTHPVTAPIAVMTLFLLAVMATPVGAANEKQQRPTPPGHARFEGRTIDLTRGWGDAHTCVVWNQDGETDCYRTAQAADAAVDRRERAETKRAAQHAARMPGATIVSAAVTTRRAVPSHPPIALFASQCSTWLTLYEHPGFGGRTLRFRDRGYTQDLSWWGFANETSSYLTGACAATFRDSGGSEYPGYTGPNYGAYSMWSGWDNRVRYLRIH